ncbi:Transcriptional regulator, HxlR family [Streptococcus suis TL13]|nr:Transcriptional regulator, HxlR family [Streptococcus suis TL13]
MHRRLTGISQATLTKQLRQLEDDGLITRKVYAQVPPKVEYELSEIGQEFKMVLQQIEVFGDKYINFVKS